MSVHESIDGPKLRNLYKSLGCSKFEASGILIFLWFWGLKNADESGKVEFADKEDVERYLYGVGAGCSLDFQNVVGALIETGWIDQKDGELYIHDWDTWQKEWYSYQKRLEKDRLRAREYRVNSHEKFVGAVSKQETNGDIQIPIQQENNRQTGAKQPKTEQKEETIKKSAYTNEFEEFWKVYPRKKEKGNAFKQYSARLNQGWRPEELLMAAKRYAAECKKNRIEEKYIKHGATFLSANTPFVDYLPKEQELSKKAEPDVPSNANPFAKYEE